MPSDAACDAIVESPTRYKLGTANTAEANETRTEIRKNMLATVRDTGDEINSALKVVLNL
jgi:hypothetical protein